MLHRDIPRQTVIFSSCLTKGALLGNGNKMYKLHMFEFKGFTISPTVFPGREPKSAFGEATLEASRPRAGGERMRSCGDTGLPGVSQHCWILVGVKLPGGNVPVRCGAPGR